jgi:hypothetical protein
MRLAHAVSACMVKSVSITDTQFRISVGVAGIALVAGLTTVRFWGSVSLPAKPPPPTSPSGTSSELLTRSSASPAVYQDFVGRDAAAAGVHAPTIEELSRKLPYREDEARHLITVGQPALELAGVRLRAVRLTDKTADTLALEVANATDSDIAYAVVTAPIPAAGCNAAPVQAFNAMTIPRGRSETRVECGWRDNIALAVTRVETVEVSPLSAWYLNHVPPSVVGIQPRIARGHLVPATGERCSVVMSQAVRSGLERGEIGWRDLIDFYARHRCQTYQFPLLYRAFKVDGERDVPAVSVGM